MVQAGDFIGIHYTSSPTGPPGTGVVPYENVDIRLINAQREDADLHLGSTWTFSLHSNPKMPALVAVMERTDGI